MADTYKHTRSDLQSLHYFSELDDYHFELIYPHLDIRHLQMGELLLGDKTLPTSLYFQLDGELRQHVYHPVTNKRLTLRLHRSPFIAGLASYNARLPVEFITAASHTTVLALKISIIEELVNKYEKLSSLLIQDLSVSDIWPIASTLYKSSVPQSSKELQAWTDTITQSSEQFWFKNNDEFDVDKIDYSGVLVAAHVPGKEYLQELSREDIKNIKHLALESPARIINIAKNKTYQSNILNLNHENSKATLEATNITSLNSPTTTPSPSENSDKDNSELYADFKFFESGEGIVPETIACFKTISHELNLPIKYDLIKSIIEDHLSKDKKQISLDFCASILESLGLQTQLLKIPIELIGRIETPCLFKINDKELCVGLMSRPGELLVSRPTQGIQSLDESLLSRLTNSKDNLPILILRKTARTPQKSFGFKWFIPSIIKHKKALIEVLIASFFVQLFQLMNPLVIQQIVDKVIGQGGISTLPVLAVLLFSFSIFENLLTAVRTNLFIDTSNRIDITLGEQIIDHLFRLPLNYFDKRPVGELSSRLSELEKIRSFLTGTALTVVIDSVFSIIYILVMIFYSWLLTIVALLIAPILAFIIFLTSPIIRRQLRTKAELNASTQNHLIEVLTGIQTVKAQNFELKARWKWKQKYSNYVAEGFKNAVTSTSRNSLTAFLNQFSALSILCAGAYLVLAGDLSLGELIAFRIIAGYVNTPLLRLSNLYQSFQQTSISLERLSDIIDTPQESTDLDKKNIPIPAIQGQVSYEDVSFRFNSKGPLQLSKVDINVEAGQFVAIVGQSGSGKSTLTKLLTRLYEPVSGLISIDKMDISKVELYSLRRQIGVVPQDSLLFEGSVQENIALSNPEATSEEVVAAARVACAHEFIMSLSSGYATSVGERGGALSGGQRQRIAIARTILQNPRLLIMDEATSALDYQTERLVSLNIMDQFKGRTVFFITHRLNSIIHADKIILMNKGHVDEVGTHEELMDLKGRYYALFSQQNAQSTI